MSEEKKIAVIELTTYHEECLFSQLQFLKEACYDITLIINPKNSKNIPFYPVASNKIKFYNPRASKFFIKRIINWIHLYRFLTSTGFGKVVFNTASSNKEVIALTKFLPKRIQCFGIIHNLKKLNSSTSQKIVSQRIKDYYVLNEYLQNSLKLDDLDIKLHAFYPIFFPNYDTVEIKAKNDDFWICIPGEVNYSRRDYDIVISALAHQNRISNLKIIILGKLNPRNEDAKRFIHQVQVAQLENYLITFDQFIGNDVFHTYLKQSDFILAPVSVKEKSYLSFKITGAYNLAFAYKKPLICPQELSCIPDLKAHSLFYSNDESLSNLMTAISEGKLQLINDYKDEKWKFEQQQKIYLKLLEE